MLNGLEEHLRRTNPEAAIAIELTVHDHRLQRLGVLGEPLKAMEIPLEVPELATDQTCLTFIHVLPSHPLALIEDQTAMLFSTLHG